MAPIKIVIPGEPVAKGRPKFTVFLVCKACRKYYVKGRSCPQCHCKNFTIQPSPYTPTKTRKFEELVAQHGKEQYKGNLLEGALYVRVYSYFAPLKSFKKAQKEVIEGGGTILKTTKPDTDNLFKSVLDGLEGVVFKNDSQVSQINAKRMYFKHPQTVVYIEEIKQ